MLGIKQNKLPKYWRKLRALAANRRDGFAPYPGLDRNACRAGDIDPQGAIRAAHAEYTTSVSIPEAAVSLETVYTLLALLRHIQPRVAADCGSGFSSYALRLYEQERQQAGTACPVYSCDDDEAWLGRTREYLEKKGLSAERLFTWPALLEQIPQLGPLFVFYDLGGPGPRAKFLPAILDACAPGSTVIVDDVHKPYIRQALLKTIEGRGLKRYDLAPWTFDRFGRFAWLLGIPG